MVRWVVGSIPHGGPMAGITKDYVLSCLWDDASKRTLAASRK